MTASLRIAGPHVAAAGAGGPTGGAIAMRLSQDGADGPALTDISGMLARGAARIVTIASVVYGGEVVQAEHVAAMEGGAPPTRTLAAEFAPGVTVSAVAPGLTRTSLTATMPEAKAAWMVTFLASTATGFVTAGVLAVSGGIHPHL